MLDVELCNDMIYFFYKKDKAYNLLKEYSIILNTTICVNGTNVVIRKYSDEQLVIVFKTEAAAMEFEKAFNWVMVTRFYQTDDQYSWMDEIEL